ncbi:MAG: TRAP transporter substrate-binding protein [Rhodospirillales bacterium]
MIDRVLRVAALATALIGLSAVSLPAFADSADEAELKRLAQDLPKTKIRVLGIWSNTPAWSLLQKPFWSEQVKDLSGGKIEVELVSMTELNMQGPEAFRHLKAGLVDIVDMIANYAAGDAAELDAMDLAGVAPDVDTEIKVINAYAPTVRAKLENSVGVVPLAMGPSLAQIVWCKGDIKSIADLKGKKIRGSSATVADLVAGLGGTPITMSFGEVPSALQRGVIDCVITGTLSGNTGKLFEVADHIYPLTVGWAPWIRAANKGSWDKLDPKVRAWLQLATDKVFVPAANKLARDATDQGIWCSSGDQRCEWEGKQGITKAKMIVVPVSDADKKVLAGVVEKNVLPSFGKSCGAACVQKWNETVGGVVGLKMQAQ